MPMEDNARFVAQMPRRTAMPIPFEVAPMQGGTTDSRAAARPFVHRDTPFGIQ